MNRRLARAVLRLVPAHRRDWARALWAEAGQAPSGRDRLAWRAGGVRLIAREALLARRAAWAVMLAGTSAWVALGAWPGPASTPATAVNRLNGITVLAMLAGLPLLVRWRFGPLAAGRLPRLLRFGAYALVLALTVAKASVEQVRDNPAAVPHVPQDASVPALTGMIYVWVSQSLFLLIIAVYLAGVLVLTAQRPWVATATRRAGTGAGLLLGAALFAAAPLGMVNPRLGAAGSVAWAVAIAAMLVLPAVAGLRAGRRYLAGSGPRPDGRGPVRQGIAAGFLTSGIATLMVMALATVVIALTARTGWMLHWLYPGQPLTPARAGHYALMASLGTDSYIVILVFVPALGMLLGMLAASAASLTGGPQLASADADGP